MYFMLDNYDSFVYNLSAYVKELGREILVKRADQITVAEVEAMNPEGITFPRSGKPPRPIFPTRFWTSSPVKSLFRCLPGPSGHCGEIRRPGGKRSPPHARKSDTDHQYGRGNLSGTAGEFSVTRYHSLVAKGELPSCLKVTARSEDGALWRWSIRAFLYTVYNSIRRRYSASMATNFWKIL